MPLALPRSLRPALATAALVALLAGCSDADTAPRAARGTNVSLAHDATPSEPPDSAPPALVRQLAAGRGIVPLPRPPHVRQALVDLGQALFFDRLISGNRDVACSTCHLPSQATGDGRSLSIGQGGSGLGPGRTHAGGVFIARNAPPLFNLHAIDALFWDGRVARAANGSVTTPAGAQLTPQMQAALEFGPVSAIALFPVTNRAEMRAERARAAADNELAAYGDDDFAGIWQALLRRLGAVPEYRRLFAAAYPGVPFDRLTFAHAANAIGGFLVARLAFADSPWDRFLAGDDGALTRVERAGARDFLTIRCSLCHNGATFSDGQFHDVALAQVGPGEGDGAGGRDDFGRMRITGNLADRYRFRTTPLRNVELTAPYGHAGQIVDLRAFVEHYSESDRKLALYDPRQLESPLRGTVLDTRAAVLAQRDTLLEGVVLAPAMVDRLTAYMRALTDPAARHLDDLAPQRVPSGLPVDRPHE